MDIMDITDKINIESSGVFKKFINGKLEQEINMNADYDGKQLEIDFDDNGEKMHGLLDNEDLMKLINQKSNNKSLEDRLLEDFPFEKSKNKKPKPKSRKPKSKNSKNKKSRKLKKTK